jgi:predicted nucleic acid-binding protein
MIAVLDTMILFQLVTDSYKIKQRIARIKADVVATTSINIYEFYLGAYLSKKRTAKRIQDINKLQEVLKVLKFDSNAGKHSALIHSKLKEDRVNLTESDWLNDILIAGIAKSQGAVLVTNDNDFERMDGVQLEILS